MCCVCVCVLSSLDSLTTSLQLGDSLAREGYVLDRNKFHESDYKKVRAALLKSGLDAHTQFYSSGKEKPKDRSPTVVVNCEYRHRNYEGDPDKEPYVVRMQPLEGDTYL